jgi:drug/metabolite transporter (DMT)-like permease
MGIGEAAGLATAALWAISSVLYSKTSLDAWSMNLGKNAIASVVLVLHLFVASLCTGRPMLTVDATAWTWLSISGLIGVVLGDTLYFRSLQILGPRQALLVAVAAPGFAAILGWSLLDESLTMLALSGMGVTVVGVAWVVSERKQSLIDLGSESADGSRECRKTLRTNTLSVRSKQDESPGLYPGSVRAGVIFGLGSAICQALGGVASKWGMESGQCDPLEASFIRLSVSAVFIAVSLSVGHKLWKAVKDIARRDRLKWLVPACFLGTYLGIWFSQVSFKHSSVAIATTLMATSPLFAIPIVVLFMRQRVSSRAILGTLLTVLGVVLLVRQS